MFVKYCISFSLFLFFFVSCAGMPPVQEYSLARTALRAAKKFEAEKYTPKTYRKALYFYRKGQLSFKKRLYESAKEHFEQCLELAEKSEDITRWTKYRKGDYSL